MWCGLLGPPGRLGQPLGQMESLQNQCALLYSLCHFSVNRSPFILPLYPLNRFYPVLFCPSRLCVYSPPIIFIPMWIEFGVLDIPLKVGSWKLFMGSLSFLLSVLIKHSVSVMGYGFDQKFQANRKAQERLSKTSPMATESWRCCSEKLGFERTPSPVFFIVCALECSVCFRMPSSRKFTLYIHQYPGTWTVV